MRARLRTFDRAMGPHAARASSPPLAHPPTRTQTTHTTLTRTSPSRVRVSAKGQKRRSVRHAAREPRAISAPGLRRTQPQRSPPTHTHHNDNTARPIRALSAPAPHGQPRGRGKSTGAHTGPTDVTARTRVTCSLPPGCRHLDKDRSGARCTAGLIPTVASYRTWSGARCTGGRSPRRGQLPRIIPTHLEQPRARQQGAAEQPRADPNNGGRGHNQRVGDPHAAAV